MKGKLQSKIDPKHRGFTHTRLFHVLLGLLILVFILVLYNCVVREDSRQTITPEQAEAEQEHEAMYLDTFDVVGDYLFPPQKSNAEDMMTDAEKEAAKAAKDKKTDAKEAKTEPTERLTVDDIMESADPTSDPRPVISVPVPTVEKMDAPKITPIEQ
ncbi:MAG: hypothetical protein IJV27_09025 [Prevotella sp.]|nr:hypothetical protein [Prevotella sp.]